MLVAARLWLACLMLYGASMLGTTRAAIESYFRHERENAVTTVVGSLAALTVSCFFFFAVGSELARGFGVAVVVAVLALSSAAVSRWRTDSRVAATILASLESDDARQALEAEKHRIGAVIAAYEYWQGLALALGTIAIVLAVILDRPFIAGAAAGVLLAVVAEQIADYRAEERAVRYARALGAEVPRAE